MQVYNITIDNMNINEVNFLIGLSNMSFPPTPYKLNMPYKMIRYYFEKNVEKGILELDNWTHRLELSCHFYTERL